MSAAAMPLYAETTMRSILLQVPGNSVPTVTRDALLVRNYLSKPATAGNPDIATPVAEEFDARIKVMSGYLRQHFDAPGDFPSVVPHNRLDLRDLQTHLAERKARKIKR